MNRPSLKHLGNSKLSTDCCESFISHSRIREKTLAWESIRRILATKNKRTSVPKDGHLTLQLYNYNYDIINRLFGTLVLSTPGLRPGFPGVGSMKRFLSWLRVWKIAQGPTGATKSEWKGQRRTLGGKFENRILKLQVDGRRERGGFIVEAPINHDPIGNL